MTASVPLLLAACSGPKTPPPTGPQDTGDVQTGTTGDTGLDCSTPQPLPIAYIQRLGFTDAEDFELTADGRYVALSSTGNLISLNDGIATLISPNVTDGGACTRQLQSGDFIVCDRFDDVIHRIDGETGAKTVFRSSLAFPNGAVIDRDGTVFVTEFGADRVVALSEDGTELDVLTDAIEFPNGIALSIDEQRLYVVSSATGALWTLDREDGDDGWSDAVQIGGLPDGGFLDALAIDACGRAYAAEFETGNLWRFEPEGGTPALMATLPSTWTPSLRWGVGTDTFPTGSLFLSDRNQGRLFEFRLGLTGHTPFEGTR